MSKLNHTFPIYAHKDTLLNLMQPNEVRILFDLTDSSRNYLRAWLPWLDKCQCIAGSEQFIRQANRAWDQKQALTLGIWYQASLVGVMGFHHFDWKHRTSSIKDKE